MGEARLFDSEIKIVNVVKTSLKKRVINEYY